MLNLRKNRKGLTLIELLLSVTIVSIVIFLSFNLFVLGNKTHSMSVREYDLQSSIRRATEEVNKIVRYSKAVFAVPQTFVANANTMDTGWSYFMVSSDEKRIVSMAYDVDKDQFIETVIVPEQKNIKYEVFFEKEADASTDSIMKYVIKAYLTDKNGNKSDKEKIVFESTVESINAVQVVDKGTGISKGASPSLALAYRNDGQTSGKGKNQIAYITLVVDVSGSMSTNEIDKTGTSKSRIKRVIEALNGAKVGEGIIDQFGREENIFVSLIPFSTTANYPEVTGNSYSSAIHPIYDVYNKKIYTKNTSLGSRQKDTLREEIDHKLKANGGTNTGDGLRRAYHLHNDFRTTMKVNEKDQVHHYMILLVDGESTYETTNKIEWEDQGQYGSIKTGGSGRNQYSYREWETNWVIVPSKTEYKTDKGNISVSTYYPSDNSTSSYTLRNGVRDYGGKNSNKSRNSLSITGTGNTFVGTGYVTDIGKLIKKFENNKGIRSYVIGYAKGLSHRVDEIGESIGTEKDKIYSYDDSNFDLQEVFENIANDIMADFWIVTGPQIQN